MRKHTLVNQYVQVIEDCEEANMYAWLDAEIEDGWNAEVAAFAMSPSSRAICDALMMAYPDKFEVAQ